MIQIVGAQHAAPLFCIFFDYYQYSAAEAASNEFSIFVTYVARRWGGFQTLPFDSFYHYDRRGFLDLAAEAACNDYPSLRLQSPLSLRCTPKTKPQSERVGACGCTPWAQHAAPLQKLGIIVKIRK
jgi:hypothetical protein